MPQPPDVSLVTRFIFENPYPLGGVLLVVGVILGWLGLRDGRTDRLRLAVVPIVLGLAILAAGLLVITSGERARRVTRQLVEAAIAGDLVAARNLLSDSARFHFAAATNVSHDVDFMMAGLELLGRQFTIEDNSITMLKGYSESSDTAEVHLACWTREASWGQYTPSQWVLRIQRQDDGSWKVTSLTWVSVLGEAPQATWTP